MMELSSSPPLQAVCCDTYCQSKNAGKPLFAACHDVAPAQAPHISAALRSASRNGKNAGASCLWALRFPRSPRIEYPVCSSTVAGWVQRRVRCTKGDRTFMVAADPRREVLEETQQVSFERSSETDPGRRG